VRRALGAGALALTLALVGCAPTARTPGPYASKAAKAVDSVRSAVRSDLLVLLALQRRHTLAAYVSVATSEAEDSAASAASTFLSIQPPDAASDRMRSRLGDVFDEASSVLGDVRVAGRRGDRAALLASVAQLRSVAGHLDRTAEAFG
jgi:hypothetical protein